MTTTAHTPGPWSYNRDEGGMHGHVISTADYIICELPDAGDGASPDTEANARLIAAAPLLLESLQTIAGDEETCTCHTRSWYGTHHDTQCPIRIATAAIAEATRL